MLQFVPKTGVRLRSDLLLLSLQFLFLSLLCFSHLFICCVLDQSFFVLLWMGVQVLGDLMQIQHGYIKQILTGDDPVYCKVNGISERTERGFRERLPRMFHFFH